MAKRHDISGKQFKRLTAIKYVGKNKHNQSIWEFKCSCGVVKNITMGAVTSGLVQSCGCKKKETDLMPKRTTHGMSNTRTFKIWSGMFTRCTNKNNKNYAKYGAVGISICERWRKFENFLLDMGECPEWGSIDRVDNSREYSPENCRWATKSEQMFNRRPKVKITYLGVTRSQSQWSRILGINHQTISSRIRRGESPAKALGFE